MIIKIPEGEKREIEMKVVRFVKKYEELWWQKNKVWMVLLSRWRCSVSFIYSQPGLNYLYFYSQALANLVSKTVSVSLSNVSPVVYIMITVIFP